MGLPLFVLPVETVAPGKAVEKLAAIPRSSIRRTQSSLLRPNARSVETRRARLSNLSAEVEDGERPFDINRDPGVVDITLRRGQMHPWEPVLQAEVQDRVNERMRVRDASLVERSQNPASQMRGPNAEGDQPRQSVIERGQDPIEQIEYELQSPPLDEEDRRIYAADQGLQRRSALITDGPYQSHLRRDVRRFSRRRPAPTPPAELGASLARAVARMESVEGVGRENEHNLDHLARSLNRAESGDGDPRWSHQFAQSIQRELESITGSSTHEPPAVLARSRMIDRHSNLRARARRLSRQARLDGLGDRDRSLSPDNGGAWEVLLTSITPDPQPPSIGSSFASTSAAAAATSSSSGTPSVSTSMTSLGQPENHECEISEIGSNTEDEDEDTYQFQQSGQRRHHSSERNWPSYAEAADLRASRSARRDHLDSMHQIISGLAGQDNIPDEWWASAGLSRNLRQ